MNFDMNDGIPPYDLPFDDNSNDEKSQNNEINDQIKEENTEPIIIPQDDELASFPTDEVVIPPDSEQLNVGEFVDGIISEDYAPEPENKLAQQQHSKNSSKIYLVLILLAGLFAAGSLFLIFGTDLVPNLKAKLSFNINMHKFSSDKKETQIENGSDLADTGVSSDENYQDISIDIQRNRNKMPSDMKNIDENLDLPPLPGTNGAPSREDLIARAKDSNNEVPVNKTKTFYSGNVGRMDPFNPNGGSNELSDVLVPPINPTPDIEAQMLLSLTISGIMYTPDAPSALINIAGVEQLVRTGDKFDNFSVLKITKDKVTVKSGKNIYTASVGEIVNIYAVGVNAVPNLNRKFAGPYSKGSGRIIEINTIN